MRSKYLICYDIRDEKRLAKVYKYMRGIGLHLQFSVFYAILDWGELLKVKSDLDQIINDCEDDIRIYPLPSEPKVIVLGKGDKIPDGVTVFIR